MDVIDSGEALSRDRAVLAAPRRRWALRTLERQSLRSCCRVARAARPLRSLPLGAPGLRAGGTVRDRAGAGVERGDGAWCRRRGWGRCTSPGSLPALPVRDPALARGVIPDIDEAVESPHRLSDDADCARRLLELVPEVPTPVWGRDELRAGEMWNSNSTISWLIARSGIDVESIPLPHRGRAPGWHAGIVVARRQPTDAASGLALD